MARRNYGNRPRLPIAELCQRIGVPRSTVDAVIRNILDAAFEGYIVRLPRFGTFSVHGVKARQCHLRNRKGEAVAMEIPAGLHIRFHPTYTLRRELNEQSKGRADGTDGR